MATYVISDVHSHKENLDRFLRTTTAEDTIYCPVQNPAAGIKKGSADPIGYG